MTILSMFEGPLAVFTLNGGETLVLSGENTLEAKRQAAIATAAAEAIAGPGAAANVDFDGRSVAQVLAQLLYTSLSINIMTVTPSQIERGIVANVTVAWTFSGPLTGQTLDGLALPVADRSKTFIGLSTSKTFNLAATNAGAPGGTDNTTRSASLTVLPRRFWGAVGDAALNGAAVIALSNSELSADRFKSFAVDGGVDDGKYVYLAYLAELGDPAAYKIFGSSETPVKTTVSVTTAAGLTANYTVLRSPEKIIGTANVEVQ